MPAAHDRDVNLDVGERVHVAAWAERPHGAHQLPRLDLDGAPAARRAPVLPGEHVVVAVEGNWLVLAPAPVEPLNRSPAWNHVLAASRSIIAVIAAIFVFQTFKIVPQQNAWVVERLGKYDRTLTPGLELRHARSSSASPTSTR